MTRPPSVVVVAARPSEVEPLLASAADQADFTVGDGLLLREAIQTADVAFLWDYASDLLRQLWPSAQELRWVHVAAAGVDRVMFPELRASQVVVTNSRGVFDLPVAEHALALMLGHAKRLDRLYSHQIEARWRLLESEQLAGKTLVILGMGSIGRVLAARAEALGMRVLGWRRSSEAGQSLSSQLRQIQLRTLLRQADYLAILLPLTDETRGLIGTGELGLMKRTAYLLNLGRGGIVDEPALLQALEERIIAGAALDVFEHEPLPPEHPLWRAPGMLVSPHMAGESLGWQRRVIELFVENLQRYRRGAELLNVVDNERGY